ncbi:MAG: hypothetical protein Q4A32_11960 [Lachnospiraceae bacterium]|nr:hypothetical protein [Lachnospiraceae bacterium]
MIFFSHILPKFNFFVDSGKICSEVVMIGREKEQEELLRRFQLNRAEFVAVYGRRRVGKTTLIDDSSAKWAFFPVQSFCPILHHNIWERCTTSPPDVVSQAGTKILAQEKMHFALES